LPLEFVEPVVNIFIGGAFCIAADAIEAQSDNFDRHMAIFIQEPHVSLDAVGAGFLQMGVTPQMQTLTTADPNLIYMSGHVGALFVVSCRLSGYTRSKGLKASVQKGRVELTGVELSMRSIGNLHFTQHFTVASPQLSDALERGAIVDATFAKPSIVVLSGDLLRASSLELRGRFPFDN